MSDTTSNLVEVREEYLKIHFSTSEVFYFAAMRHSILRKIVIAEGKWRIKKTI